MFWIVSILFFVFIIIWLAFRKKETGQPGQASTAQPAGHHPLEIETNQPEEPNEPPRKFYDREQYFTDYSYLSPSEARKEFNELKEAGEYLDFDDYGGYMNAIHANSDDAKIEKIERMSPEQCLKWFQTKTDQGDWITSAVFEAISEKLKPYHEEYLLKEMDNITPGRIEGWVNARKKEGYFFSYNAYMKAEKIFRGEIDNRKKGKKDTPEVNTP
jgi:hypothetical protein